MQNLKIKDRALIVSEHLLHSHDPPAPIILLCDWTFSVEVTQWKMIPEQLSEISLSVPVSLNLL